MDIDIDFRNRNELLDVLTAISASIVTNGKLSKHPCGVYLQRIPVDPISNIATIPASNAEERGWFKIDFLNNNTYSNVKDEAHLIQLMKDPVWELFENEEFINALPHVRGHFDIVSIVKPNSIEELAVVLALIRPAKRHLLSKPLSDIMKTVWDKDGDSYAFKRSHAIAYAQSIVVAANILTEGLL